MAISASVKAMKKLKQVALTDRKQGCHLDIVVSGIRRSRGVV